MYEPQDPLDTMNAVDFAVIALSDKFCPSMMLLMRHPHMESVTFMGRTVILTQYYWYHIKNSPMKESPRDMQ